MMRFIHFPRAIPLLILAIIVIPVVHAADTVAKLRDELRSKDSRLRTMHTTLMKENSIGNTLKLEALRAQVKELVGRSTVFSRDEKSPVSDKSLSNRRTFIAHVITEFTKVRKTIPAAPSLTTSKTEKLRGSVGDVLRRSIDAAVEGMKGYDRALQLILTERDKTDEYTGVVKTAIEETEDVEEEAAIAVSHELGRPTKRDYYEVERVKWGPIEAQAKKDVRKKGRFERAGEWVSESGKSLKEAGGEIVRRIRGKSDDE